MMLGVSIYLRRGGEKSTKVSLRVLCKLKTLVGFLDDSYHYTISQRNGINMQ